MAIYSPPNFFDSTEAETYATWITSTSQRRSGKLLSVYRPSGPANCDPWKQLSPWICRNTDSDNGLDIRVCLALPGTGRPYLGRKQTLGELPVSNSSRRNLENTGWTLVLDRMELW